jgi:hypothetical protein
VKGWKQLNFTMSERLKAIKLHHEWKVESN